MLPPERIARILERKGMLTSGCAGGMVFSVEAAVVTRGTKTQAPEDPLLDNHQENAGIGQISGHLQHHTGCSRGCLGGFFANDCDPGRLGASQCGGQNCGSLFSESDRYAGQAAALHRVA